MHAVRHAARMLSCRRIVSGAIHDILGDDVIVTTRLGQHQDVQTGAGMAVLSEPRTNITSG